MVKNKAKEVDFKKINDELKKDDYVDGMQKYYNKLLNLSTTNNEEAIRLAKKALVLSGVIEIDLKENSQKNKKLVRQRKKQY